MGLEREVKRGEYKLNRREELFCREYLKDFCGAAACRRAGYNAKSSENYGRTAHRMLGKNKIRERLAKLTADRFKAVDIEVEKVLEEISKVAFINLKSFVDDDGNMLPPGQIKEEDFAAVSELTERVLGSGDNPIIERKYKLADKLKALEMLGRYLKLFTDKTEHSVDSSLANVLKDIDGGSTGLPGKSG